MPPSPQAYGPAVPKTGPGESFDTRVGILIPALFAVLATSGFLGLLYAAKDQWISRLFLQRGPVPYIVAFMAFLCFGILLVKWWKVRKQTSLKKEDPLPTTIGLEIRRSNLDAFQRHLDSLPPEAHRGFLVRRVRRALELFAARGKVQEVIHVLNSQAEIDQAKVESSYTMLKVMVWAMPILGFIGTVLGIGAAVNGFSDSLAGTNELDQIRTSLGTVTSGLSVAFDTTLIALIASLLVMFPARSLQKSEEDLLTWVDSYTQEQLVPRLAERVTEDQRDSISQSKELLQALARTQASHSRQLAEQVAQLARAVSEKMAETWQGTIQESMTKQQEQLGMFQSSFQQAADAQKQAIELLQNNMSQVEKRLSGMQESCTKEFADTMQEISSDLKGMLAQSSEIQEENLSLMRSNTDEFSKALEKICATADGSQEAIARRLSEQIGSLDSATEVLRSNSKRMSRDIEDVRSRYSSGVNQAAQAFTRMMQSMVSDLSSQLGQWDGDGGNGQDHVDVTSEESSR